MTCNCGCHDDKSAATGWRKFVPLIVGVTFLAAIVAGAILKKNDAGKGGNEPRAAQSAALPKP